MEAPINYGDFSVLQENNSIYNRQLKVQSLAVRAATDHPVTIHPIIIFLRAPFSNEKPVHTLKASARTMSCLTPCSDSAHYDLSFMIMSDI